MPEPDEAAPRAIAAWFGAYGPAPLEAFGNWLAGGWFGKRRLAGWLDALGDSLALVDVEGEPAYVLAEHLEDLAATKPTTALRLLGGFDQWVLGPGTADVHVIPASRRAAVSRQSGWIAPVVVAGGVVSGTWELDGDSVTIGWFEEAGMPPNGAVEAEVERLSSILDRPLRAEIEVS